MNTAITHEQQMKLLGILKVLSLVVLCIWLSSVLARITWLSLVPETIPQVSVYSASHHQGNKGLNNSPTLNIVSDLLFGQAPVVSEVVETKVVDAPKTRLRLRLMGVFVGQSAALSTAIISEQGRPKAEYYRVGDTVQSGVSLEQVHEDRVILNRNGRLEALFFEESNSLFEAATKAPVVPKNDRLRTQISTVDQFANAAKKQWGKNPLSALGAVGFSPVSATQAKGYRFTGQNPMMARYGIQKGDVIISVNGIDVGNVKTDGNHLDQVFEQGQASVVVERGSRQFEVTVPLK
jgi:general secretion pathway protein C